MTTAQAARPLTSTELDQLCINTIRTLSIDAVQQAKSGHPGTPMALAPLVYTLWNQVMNFGPLDPIWPNRDRFVLSNGHASMLLWSILHLTQTQGWILTTRLRGSPLSLLMTYVISGNSGAGLPGIRNIGGFRELKRRPGRLAKVWLRVWEWRSRKSGSPVVTTNQGLRFSTTKSTQCVVTAA